MMAYRATLRVWCVFCLVLLVLAQLPAAAATYYVSPTGSDLNDGSAPDDAHAWASIDKGDKAKVLNPGDTVLIEPGTYTLTTGGDGPTISNRSGTIGQPITYKADGGDVIVDASALPGQAMRIFASYIVLDGISTKGGTCCLYIAGSTGSEVKNCWFNSRTGGGNGPGVWADGSTNGLKFHNNVIGPDLPQYSHGIACDATGANNKFFNNVIIGSTDWAFVTRTTVAGVEFRNNIIHTASNGIYGGNASLAHSHNIVWNLTGQLYYNTSTGIGEVTADPMFDNTGGFASLSDFALQPGSPAIDSGVFVGLPYNDTAPDIGAFETAGTPGPIGTINGTVTNAASGDPMSGATVQLKQSGNIVFQTTTAADGTYSFQWQAGSFTVAASYPGYRPASTSVTLTDSETVQADFGLLAATPTTFYVSMSGNDDNDGLTLATAWATMDKGDRDNVLIPGDTVRIQAGTYADRQVTLSNKSGAAGNPITYVADGEVVIDRFDNNGATFSMVANGLSNLVFDAITFTGGTGGIQFNDCDNLEIKNCVVHDLQFPAVSGGVNPGIWLIRTSHAYLHNNLLYGTLGHVIVQDFGGPGNKYYNNTIYTTMASWAFLCGWAKDHGGDPNFSTGAEWKNNICVTSGGYGIAQYTQVNHSNNLFWPATGNNIWSYAGSAAMGPGDFAADPKVLDTWLPDFHLQSGSPAIDAGAVVGLPFNGGWPDIGAFETSGTPNPGTMGTVTGTVTDAVAGTPIAGATVAAGPNSNVSTTTDANGNYTLQVLTGSQSVSASKILYYKLTKTTTVGAEPQTVDFALQPVPPKTYYVSTTGSDSNDGSAPDDAHAWRTIDKGDRDQILNPGDTVIVLPGTYNVQDGNGDAPPFAKRSGLPGRPITYRSQYKWGAIVDRGTDGGTTLSVRGPAHIVIDGFQLVHGRIPIATVNSDDVEITNCWIHDKNYSEGGWGIWLIGASNHKVHNNVIGPNMAFPCHGIDDYSPTGPNTFYNNTIVGTTDWAFVARTQALGQEFRNNIVYGVTNGVYTENANLARSHNIYFDVTGTMFASGGLALGESVADPLFTDPDNSDYTLGAGSPAIDAGALVGLPFNGTWPDIGALETAGTPGALGGTISGRVTNAATGVGLIGATVSAGPNNNAFGITDDSGNYSFQLPTGTYTAMASATGFTSASQSVDVGAEPQTLNFALDPTPAHTYYVSPTGSDGNDGLTPATAWATIDKGDRDNVVVPGDVVNILPGTYTLTTGGDGPTFANRSGTANRPITYQAYGGSVQVDATPLPGGASRIYASYIVLDGLHFKGGIYGLYVGGSVGSEVKNCSWTDKEVFGWPFVVVDGASKGLKFHNNWIAPRAVNYCHGIIDQSSGGNHKFYNNTLVGVSDWAFISTVSTSGVEFRNNIIYNAGSGSIYGANFAHSNNILSSTGANYGNGATAGSGEFVADPLFANAGADDYHLQAGSPAIDAGIDVGLPFAGAAPDLGAFEYAPAFESANVGDLLAKADGTAVKLTTSVVTVPSGVFSDDVIYVEDESRAAGIRVHAPSANALLGDRVSVEGTMATTAAGERMIEATQVTFISAGDALTPLGTAGKAISGDGLDNSGLLVKIWGNVTFKADDNSYFCVDDGSGKSDGLGHAGIPVIVSDLTSGLGTIPSSGYALVTGVAGAKDLGGGVVPVVRVRGSDDID